MANPEITRNPTAQSKRSLKHQEQRRVNHSEEGGAFIVHDTYETTAAEDVEADAEWGDPFLVLDYERLCLFIKATKGAATSVHVRLQVAYFENAQTGDWYDMFGDTDGDGALEDSGVVEVTIAADANVAITVPLTGVYMRAKVWMSDADATSRVIVRGARLMNAS